MNNNVQPVNVSANHLECPKCGKHNIVQYQETRYICLSCDWEKDISESPSASQDNKPFSFPFWIGTGLFLALVL